MVIRKKEASLERNIDRLFQKKNDNSRKKCLKTAGPQENWKIVSIPFLDKL